jgi:hypothetical protein
LHVLTFRLVEPIELGQRPATIDVKFGRFEAQRGRTIERGERFFGALQMRQERAQIVMSGHMARRHDQRLPVGGFGFFRSILLAQYHAKSGPRTGVPTAAERKCAAAG